MALADAAARPRTGRYESIVDAIGHTPLVAIPRMSPNPDVAIYAKLEFMNPTGSVKDRVARALIEDLEASGRLDARLDHPGAHQRQHRHRAGHDRAAQGLSDRRRAARQRDPGAATAACACSAPRSSTHPVRWVPMEPLPWRRSLVARDPRYVMPYQYGNPANPGVHETTTAEEIIADCPEVDVFVAGLGTGGTLMGVGRTTEATTGRTSGSTPPSRCPGDAVQGLRSLDEGFIPEIFDPSVLDGKFLVSNAESITALRDLTARRASSRASRRGVPSWLRSGSPRPWTAGTIVVLLADGGWKYLSEDVWDRDLDADHDEVERLSLW